MHALYYSRGFPVRVRAAAQRDVLAEAQIALAVVLQRAVQYAGTVGIAHPDSYCAERAVVAPPAR